MAEPRWKYHIGPATAEMLRIEHGITETDLLGMRCLVGPGIPPGKVYMVVDPPKPAPATIPWLVFGMGPILKKDSLIVLSGIA